MKGKELSPVSTCVMLCLTPWEPCPSLNGDGGGVECERVDGKLEVEGGKS